MFEVREYPATVVRVIDGDTVDLTVDVGFSFATKERFRLLGINTPERKQETRQAGDAAMQHLNELLAEAADAKGRVMIRTHKNKVDKYGRYLVVILFQDGTSLNDRMVSDGHAVPYMVEG
jgi:micrococcal nuclease